MVNITDKNHLPDISELEEYIGNPLFRQLYDIMNCQYRAHVSVEYSGDRVLYGWNIRFYKSGKTLCRVYPEKGGFSVLLVIGKNEKEPAELLLDRMSDEMRKIYRNTKEGMGQRWLLFRPTGNSALFGDMMSLIELRGR